MTLPEKWPPLRKEHRIRLTGRVAHNPRSQGRGLCVGHTARLLRSRDVPVALLVFSSRAKPSNPCATRTSRLRSGRRPEKYTIHLFRRRVESLILG